MTATAATADAVPARLFGRRWRQRWLPGLSGAAEQATRLGFMFAEVGLRCNTCLACTILGLLPQAVFAAEAPPLCGPEQDSCRFSRQPSFLVQLSLAGPCFLYHAFAHTPYTRT
jgi:hypothetical protein